MGAAGNKDKLLIRDFVEYLRENGHPGLRVECWPDAKNRTSRDIDALAGEFAIEHTSIDTVVNQRRDDAWFEQVVDGLRAEFEDRITYRLRIVLCWESIRVGQDWDAIRAAFRRWIAIDSLRLPDGKQKIKDAPGIPFPFFVEKDNHRPPGVFFSRREPKDSTLPDRIRERMVDKVSKLAPYRTLGHTTVLLLESPDLALMNPDILIDAIKKAFPSGLPAGLDRVWFADTSVPECGPVFCEISTEIIC